MRRTIKLVTLAAMLALLAAPAFAQAKECNDEFKSATYQKWYDNRKDHQDVAYAAAKDYLATCTTDDQYSAALKNFVKLMDDANASASLLKQFDDAYKAKAYADQIRIGKQILATAPDNTTVYIVMGMAGFSEPSVLSESAQYAKKAIEMIEAGKPAAPFTREQALAYLNWTIAKASLKSAPAAAIPYLLKAARIESEPKKNFQLYLDLAGAYEEGPRAKLEAEYKSKVGPNQTETPESKLAFANLSQMIDRQIDAWARAEALATDAAVKKAIMDDLGTLYEYRNKSKTGLNELLAGILSKPIPDVPTPLTSLPTPVSTPATTGAASGTNGTTSSNTSTNGQNKTGATGATGAQNGNKATTAAKPSPSPTPANKKPRAHHRRG